MHLSHLRLPAHSSRWALLTPYQIHQVIWKGFGSDSCRPLWRHEIQSVGGQSTHSILVQSARVPEGSWLSETGGEFRSKLLTPSFIRPGARFRFFLRANPTVERKGFPDGQSRRILVGSDPNYQARRMGVEVAALPDQETQLLEWLQRKATAGGFSLVAGEVFRKDTLLFSKKPGRSKASIRLDTVDFRGILAIEEPEVFRQAFSKGIGRGKAFGCGLLSLAAE